MNAVDATEHYETSAHDPAPSLLTVVIDTNPHVWALLEKDEKKNFPFSTAVANILVFLNAHLACNYANEVAVVASHTHKAAWLYPSPSSTSQEDSDGDVAMTADSSNDENNSGKQVNKYRPFRIVEEQVTSNLKHLMDSTSRADVESNTSTMMAGALTLALTHINRRTIAWAEAHGGDITHSGDQDTARRSTATNDGGAEGLQSRILIISVSSATGSAHQYIPIMNGIFACQRLHIPIDVCKLSGDAVFLQQASDATKGIYMPLSDPRGLLQYLMMAFLPDQRSRKHLVLPTRVDVDFRAACFCHRRVVDIGLVCSICLSIFCEPPENGDCLTCGTHLDTGDYGAKPAVVARKKKKKKVRPNGVSATPTPTPTPGP
ncbi:TFIIH/NER complex subunit TFB4 [Aspergillus puulaauensis]|uniref:General transcription and DNA repair factor IIH subunit TFB4 n=1 Tax=Aspergillus puulaauensis TaxID=1220207 RepID=A0A7R7XD19_9EURO|nr:RNA polymerase II transcription factor B subunit 4 [Aspergillus puulaauensis]BCS19186.1 RNA polymerase II transcription factor B subunit 4 [Aspergillus puulaauensis]